MNNLNNKSFDSELPDSLILAEVTSDLTKMFEAKSKLSTEYTYGRMSDEEFRLNRQKCMHGGISTWFGMQGPYFVDVAGRILRKTGYKVRNSDFRLACSETTKLRINSAIDNACSMFLSIEL